MSKEKLNNLIDKAIGKDGPLRVPSYWMRKVLGGMVDWVNGAHENIEANKEAIKVVSESIPTKVSQLENDSEYATVDDIPKVIDYEEGYDSSWPLSNKNPKVLYEVMPPNCRSFYYLNHGESIIYTFLDPQSSLVESGSDNYRIKNGHTFGLYKISFFTNELGSTRPWLNLQKLDNDYFRPTEATFTTTTDNEQIFIASSGSVYYKGKYIGAEHTPAKAGDHTYLVLKEKTLGKYGFGPKLKKVKLSNFTIIEEEAFKNRTNLEQVLFYNEEPIIIKRYAFSGTSIKSLEIENAELEYRSFENCTKLTSVYLKNMLKIDSNAFGWSKEQTSVTDIKINSYTVDADWTDSFTAVKKLVFEEGVVEINANLFPYSYDIEEISFPSTVEFVGTSFSGTNWFKNLNDGALYIGKTLVAYKGEVPEKQSFVVKYGTKYIANNALKGKKNLTSISLPPTVTQIGLSAFYESNLSDITIPEGVEDIFGHAFRETNITSIHIPSSVTYMGACVFQGCEKLTSVTMSEGITYLSSRLFFNCSSLSGMNIPSTITSFEDEAFASCHNLETIQIPKSVISIGYSCFRDCSSLRYCDFSSHEIVPTMSHSESGDFPYQCDIIVPDGLYEEWISATNWSIYADQIIKKSDWDAQQNVE